MTTSVALDDKLIQKAVNAGKHKTKKAAVVAALNEYVKLKKRIGVFDLIGKIDYDPAYDYKAERRRNTKRIGRL